MFRYLRLAIRIVFIALLLYSFWLMLQLSLPYTAMQPGIDFLQTKQFVYHLRHWRYGFYVHVFSSIFVLVCGLLQFSSYIIIRLPLAHRISGYIYIITVLLISGPAALILAFHANGGWPARVSFITLSVLWWVGTLLALLKARNRQFVQHGNWMLRSYALTLSAITLRTYALLLGMLGVGMHPVQEYILISWASWLPNLLVAEWLLRSGYIQRLLQKRNAATA